MTMFRYLPTALPAILLLQACGGETEPMADEATSAGPRTAQTAVPVKTGLPAGAATSSGAAPENLPKAAAAPAEFAVCRACHSVEPGKNGAGPSLHGIVGEKAGAVPGYVFSAPLKSSGIVWNRATLDEWLTNPMRMVPGTKMVLPVSDAARRKAIIDYLVTLK
jgi:cytochrome c